jgi:hypothetical protein
MITVVTPAESQALTTRGAAVEMLGTHANGLGSALVDSLVARASALAADYAGRTFARETYRETLRLRAPAECIALSRWPVRSITSVTVDGVTLDPSGYELESPILSRLDGTGAVVPWSPGRIVATFVAGYILPGENGRDLPQGVEAAALAIVLALKSGIGQDPWERSSEIADIGTVTHARADSFLPDTAKAALDPHRVVLL